MSSEMAENEGLFEVSCDRCDPSEEVLLYRIPLLPVPEDEEVPAGAVVIDGFLFVPLPKLATPGSAAMDFYSANLKPVEMYPGEIAMIPLGVKVAIPIGYKLTIKPRSGLAINNGITIVNSPGTVDSDYRGEVKVILQNTSDDIFKVEPFMRICQGEIEVVTGKGFSEVASEEALGSTERGAGGFNSTGTK